MLYKNRGKFAQSSFTNRIEALALPPDDSLSLILLSAETEKQ